MGIVCEGMWEVCFANLACRESVGAGESRHEVCVVFGGRFCDVNGCAVSGVSVEREKDSRFFSCNCAV